MNTQGDVFEVIEAIYATSFKDRGWDEVLSTLSIHMGAVGSVVLDIDAATGTPTRVVSEGLNDADDDYALRMHGLNPCMAYSLSHTAKHTIYDYQVVDKDFIVKSEFYNWLQTECGVKYFIGSRLNETGPITTLAAVHFSEQHGHAERKKIERFKLLSPHIANAWQVYKLKERAQGAATFAGIVAEALPWGLIGIDHDGKCTALNGRAEHIIMQNDGLAIDKDGRLRAGFAAVDRTLQKLIGEVLKANRGESVFAGSAISVPRQSGQPDLVVQLSLGISRAHGHDPDHPAALVIIGDPCTPATIDITQLQDLFGVSDREGELVQLLVSGNGMREASAAMGISRNTARVHLQNVFAKTQTKSQIELINKIRMLHSTRS